jgi:hypothetical protein
MYLIEEILGSLPNKNLTEKQYKKRFITHAKVQFKDSFQRKKEKRKKTILIIVLGIRYFGTTSNICNLKIIEPW